MFSGKARCLEKRSVSSDSSKSQSSWILVNELRAKLESLKSKCTRSSTYRNYYNIWCNFNKFLVQLDYLPESWEDRTTLYCTHLIEKGLQSATLRSYVSAIKGFLLDDNYKWNDDLVLLGTLTKACRLKNDKVKPHLPIHIKLLDIILFEVERNLGVSQPYLEVLYKTIFAVGYYGLFRIGELTAGGEHTILATNVHVARKKEKILIILYLSKTHGKESRPQKVKITSIQSQKGVALKDQKKNFFCPFKLIKQFISMRGGYDSDMEPFFIFRDGTPVSHRHVRAMLRRCIGALGLNSSLYDCHSMRSGRSVDLLRFGYTVEQIKQIGRWQSNAVYKYLKD